VSESWPHELAAAMKVRQPYATEVCVYATLESFPVRKDATMSDPFVSWWARLIKRLRPDRELSQAKFRLPEGELCTCQGNGIDQRGGHCVCDKGRQLYRASVVEGRPPAAGPLSSPFSSDGNQVPIAGTPPTDGKEEKAEDWFMETPKRFECFTNQELAVIVAALRSVGTSCGAQLCKEIAEEQAGRKWSSMALLPPFSSPCWCW
jgi:hypothetical protein